MSEKTKLTIITPYYKGEKTIYNTIDSVLCSLYKVKEKFSLEYIVIIDSMEDKVKTVETLTEKYGDKISIIQNEKNMGVAESRNKALKIATGKYILLLDQDDDLKNDYFIKLEKAFETNMDLIITNGYICNKKNGIYAPIFYTRPVLNKRAFLKMNKIPTPGLVWFSNKIAKIENLFLGCSKEFMGADDWAAYIKIFVNNPNLKIKYIKDKVFVYNLHEGNYSNNWIEINNSAIATCRYFFNIINSQDKKKIEKTISIIEFENIFKENRRWSFIKRNLVGVLDYYMFYYSYINRLIGSIHKKLIGFNK